LLNNERILLTFFEMGLDCAAQHGLHLARRKQNQWSTGMNIKHGMRRLFHAVMMEARYQEYLRISMLDDTECNREVYVEMCLERSFY
jgi:hypothetical protein